MADQEIEFREVGWHEDRPGEFFMAGYGWRIECKTTGTMSDGIRSKIEETKLRLARLEWALAYFQDCAEVAAEHKEKTDGR